MPDERKFDPGEVDEIFRRASSKAEDSAIPTRSGGGVDGLSLSELQEIAAEVGIPPEQVAEAAAEVVRHDPTLHRLSFAGMPTGVQKTFDLPRAPTDREWGRLVAELRRTFQAVGTERTSGELREWRNGNLHATIEPTEHGYQLRLGTRKGQAPLFTVLTLGWGTIGVVALAGGDPIGAVLGIVFVGAFLTPILRLPRWVTRREAQFEQIAQDVRGWLSDGLGSAEPAK